MAHALGGGGFVVVYSLVMSGSRADLSSRMGQFFRDPRRLNLISYIPPGSLLVLWLEKNDSGVRYHALQATFLVLLLAVFNLGLSLLSATAHRVSWYLGVKVDALLWWVQLAQVVLWGVLLFKAYRLQRFSLPWVGELAERLLERKQR